MNKKILVLLATCAIAASSLPLAGCSAGKNQKADLLPKAETMIAVSADNMEVPEGTETIQKGTVELKLEKTVNPSLNLLAENSTFITLASNPKAKKNTKKNAARRTEFGRSSTKLDLLRKKSSKPTKAPIIVKAPVTQDQDDNNKPETKNETVINAFGPGHGETHTKKDIRKAIKKAKEASVKKAEAEALKRAKIEASKKASSEKAAKEAAQNGAAVEARKEAARKAKIEASKKLSSEKAAREAAEKGAAAEARKEAARKAKTEASKKLSSEKAAKEAALKGEAVKAREAAARKAKIEAVKKASSEKAAKEAAQKGAAAKKNSSKKKNLIKESVTRLVESFMKNRGNRPGHLQIIRSGHGRGHTVNYQ